MLWWGGMEPALMLVLLWFTAALLVGVLAGQLQRNGAFWAVMACLCPPLVLIILAVAGYRD